MNELQQLRVEYDQAEAAALAERAAGRSIHEADALAERVSRRFHELLFAEQVREALA